MPIRSDRGKMLVTWCTINGFCIANTFDDACQFTNSRHSWKQDVMSAATPIQLQNNIIGIGFDNLGITAGNITCAGIYGGVQAQLSGFFATKVENVAKGRVCFDFS